MFFRTLRDLARPQIVAIIDHLKRSDGLAVGELAEALQMSYMGVKQYCLELEKRGYLDTWRRARETGRPELTYRLTPKAQALFPQHSNELSQEVLEAVRQLHGPTAVEKILFQYFLKKTESYTKRIKGKSLIERATSFARLRESEGYCAQVDYDAQHGLRVTEFHNPLADLMRTYPTVSRMEEAMLARLLQAPVQRDVSSVSGLMRITFLVAGATLPPPPPPASGVRSRPTAHRKKKAASPAREMQVELTDARETAPASEPRQPDPDSLQLTRAVTTGPAGAMAIEAATAIAAVSSDLPLSPVDDQPGIDPAPGTIERSADAAKSPEPAVPEILVSPISAVAEPRPTEVSATSSPRPPAAATSPRESEPYLFAPPEPATPPHPYRSVTPARGAAKAVVPDAEELFLSL